MTLLFRRWMLCFSLLLFAAVGSAWKQAPHPFFISVTEINHNAETKSVEVSCKMFTDDLEGALKKSLQASVDFSSAAQQERAGVLLNQYVQQHLHIIADGKKLPLRFVGFEREAESVYCYFEIAGVPLVRKLEITTSLLQDFTQEQINIIHATAGGHRQSTKLNYPATKAQFQF